LFVVIVGVLAAGCGSSGARSSPRAAYQARLEAAFRTEERAGRILRGGTAGEGIEAEVRRGLAGAALIRRAAQELSSSNPPADAAADTAVIAAYMRELATRVTYGLKLGRNEAKSGKSVSGPEIEKAAFTPSLERLRRRALAADRDLSAKGYGFTLKNFGG
jgi:hypothetical protein